MTKCYIVERLRGKLADCVQPVEDTAAVSEIETCFRKSLQSIERLNAEQTPTATTWRSEDPRDVAESVYRLLTSRAFSSCSRKACNPLKSAAVAEMAGFVGSGQPIRFYYDIGGGYSAAVSLEDLGGHDGPEGLSFEPNGLHLLCLAQIAQFAEQVRSVYPPGLKMFFVIDNLVAYFVNDIPVEQTLHFCNRLQSLVARLRMESLCDLLVESQHSALSRSEVPGLADLPIDPLDESQYENVLRFSGRRLSRGEAGRRHRLYCEVTRLSEKHLEPCINGVHLTQRLGTSTLPFRAFRGGSCRIQAGRLCFVRNAKGRIIPHLLTSSNAGTYELAYVPTSVRQIISPAQFVESVKPEPGITAAFPAAWQGPDCNSRV